MATHPLLLRGRLFIRTHSGLFSSLRTLERRWLASSGISAPLRPGVVRSDSESVKLSSGTPSCTPSLLPSWECCAGRRCWPPVSFDSFPSCCTRRKCSATSRRVSTGAALWDLHQNVRRRHCSRHGFYHGRCLGFLLAFLFSLPGVRLQMAGGM